MMRGATQFAHALVSSAVRKAGIEFGIRWQGFGFPTLFTQSFDTIRDRFDISRLVCAPLTGRSALAPL